MGPENIVFKGTKNGILIIVDEKLDYSALKSSLRQKASNVGHFFQESEVIVDVGNRVLTSPELLDLEKTLAETLGARLLQVVNGDAERLLAETPPGSGRKGSRSGAAGGTFTEKREEISSLLGEVMAETGEDMGAEVTRVAVETSGSQSSLVRLKPGGERTLWIRRTLRSGQSVSFDGNVIVLGDVNPGAEVIASGDIVVMGVLRGVAHAGATGRRHSTVFAFRLEPTQLRINEFFSRPPEGRERPGSRVPETARIRDGHVVIEPYFER